MEGKVLTRPAFHVVGLTFSGPWESLPVEMPKLWGRFVERIAEIEGCVDADIRYDIGSENSYGTFMEYLCVQVSSFGRIPAGMVGFTLPAQKYAVFTHSGPFEGVSATYQAAFAWLKANGHELDPEGRRFEQYQAGVTQAYDIYLPIK